MPVLQVSLCVVVKKETFIITSGDTYDFCKEDTVFTRSKNLRRKHHKEKIMGFLIYVVKEIRKGNADADHRTDCCI